MTGPNSVIVRFTKRTRPRVVNIARRCETPVSHCYDGIFRGWKVVIRRRGGASGGEKGPRGRARARGRRPDWRCDDLLDTQNRTNSRSHFCRSSVR
ncbi:hypothetical protein PUN28_014439 [Cardiocondyla obscurior]|uniref:Uncharacterized protein n=1 Tax=Cardiocondyla obscurior TaxID=286306 RepID=A0AAW2F406_9HYME